MKAIGTIGVILGLLACRQPTGTSVQNIKSSVAGAEQSSGESAETIPTPLSIDVTPTTASVAVGVPITFSAFGRFPYGIVKDLTSVVQWSVSDPKVAAFALGTASNVVTALTTGTIEISAEFKGVRAAATLVITDAILKKLYIEPAEISGNVILTESGGSVSEPVTIKLLGVYSDSSVQNLTAKAVWSIVDPNVAALETETPGILRPLKPGATTVKAEVDGQSFEAKVKVSELEVVLVSLEPKPTTLLAPLGATRGLEVTGVYSDHSRKDVSKDVTWKSSDSAVTAVGQGPGGEWTATAIGAGSTKLTATLGKVSTEIESFTAAVSVESLAVEPDQLTLPEGASQALRAIATYSDGSTADVTSAASWVSTDDSAATVGVEAPTIGLVTGKKAGAAKIEARLGSSKVTGNVTVATKQLLSITLSPSTAILPKGKTLNFTALGKYSDGSTVDVTADAVWSSGNNSLLKVETTPGLKGTSKGLGLGGTTIRAAVGGVAKIAVVTVSAPELVSLDFTYIGTPDIALGKSKQIRASATYSDTSTADVTADATWTFDSTTFGYNFAAYVLNSGTKGLVKTLGVGKIGIQALFGGQTASMDFTVTPKEPVYLDIEAPKNLINMGEPLQFTGDLYYTDDSVKHMAGVVGDPDLGILWQSSNTGVADVGNGAAGGAITTFGEGGVTITATVTSVAFGGPWTDTFVLSVQSECDVAGVRQYYFCWYLSSLGDSCDDVCGAHGASYHAATRSYAGSTGTSGQCQAVLQALDPVNYTLLDTNSATGPLGLGCSVLSDPPDEFTARYTSTPTNSFHKDPNFRRACACTH